MYKPANRHRLSRLRMQAGILRTTIVLLFGAHSLLLSSNRDGSEITVFKNVIVLVPDGCGVAHMTIARFCKGANLAQDTMHVSLVRTFNANSAISGSASSATAFATGHKTWEQKGHAMCLGMLPDSVALPEPRRLSGQDQWRPVATVLEGARLVGKATGLVATSRVSHATPAGYAAHWHYRNHHDCIMEQMVYQQIDVVFGGGYQHLLDTGAVVGERGIRGSRRDGENLVRILAGRGYRVITTAGELHSLGTRTRRAWGLFAPGPMAADMDRELLRPHEPSLVEMTAKAIEILREDPDGFFLMVEGSQVDWASHANDAAGMAAEYLAFDRAVQTALDFAASPPGRGTLVLVFPDHDNGGISLGRKKFGIGEFAPANMVQSLSGATLTAAGVEKLIRMGTNRFHPNEKFIDSLLAEHYGLADLSRGELRRIAKEFADTLEWTGPGKPRKKGKGWRADSSRINLSRIIGPMLSKRAGIGWTSFNHTGHDVPLFSWGLEPPPKTIDNTEIAGICARAMGFDLEVVSQRLMRDAGELFTGGRLEIDSAGSAWGLGSLKVTARDKSIEFPFFKNIAIRGGDTLVLEGLTLYSKKSHRVFLPAEAGGLLD